MKNDGIAQGFFLQTVGSQLFPWTAYPPVTTFSHERCASSPVRGFLLWGGVRLEGRTELDTQTH